MPDWGLWSACPEDAKIAWGARTIIEEPDGYRKKYNIDLVWDRQGTRGAEDHRNELQAFCDKLNGTVLKVAFDRACSLLRDRKMEMHEEGLFTLYDNDGVKVMGNTNGSCGYLYVIAFPTEEDDESESRST
jgi:hypothetical protein